MYCFLPENYPGYPIYNFRYSVNGVRFKVCSDAKKLFCDLTLFQNLPIYASISEISFLFKIQARNSEKKIFRGQLSLNKQKLLFKNSDVKSALLKKIYVFLICTLPMKKRKKKE